MLPSHIKRPVAIVSQMTNSQQTRKQMILAGTERPYIKLWGVINKPVTIYDHETARHNILLLNIIFITIYPGHPRNHSLTRGEGGGLAAIILCATTQISETIE